MNVCDPGRMDHKEEPAVDDEDGFDDVYGEAPPADEYELSTRPGVVSGEG